MSFLSPHADGGDGDVSNDVIRQILERVFQVFLKPRKNRQVDGKTAER